MPVAIQKSTFQFLKEIAKNNNREWFNEHKTAYTTAQENMAAFVDVLIAEMNKHDELETVSGKKSLYRIYNDVRFSKDKSPYNARFAFGLKRATKFKRGGYYTHIQPGNSFLACGFFAPNADDLKRIREDIAANYKDWNKILNGKKLKENFGVLQGDTVATAPRGFDKNQAGIELIRHKQFILRHNFTDAEVLSPNFVKDVNAIFKSVRPFFDYMSDVLTTDANGVLNV
ncbi:MAG: DUF2461 domain-containing protein [Bacteroidota bacterium]